MSLGDKPFLCYKMSSNSKPDTAAAKKVQMMAKSVRELRFCNKIR